MKPSSAKAKGRKLQQEVRDAVLAAFPELEPDDVKCAIMGESGTDLKLSPAARKKFPFSVECKNVEKLNVWAALDQAKENTKDKTDPLLVFRKNRKDAHVALSLDLFLKLLTQQG